MMTTNEVFMVIYGIALVLIIAKLIGLEASRLNERPKPENRQKEVVTAFFNDERIRTLTFELVEERAKYRKTRADKNELDEYLTIARKTIDSLQEDLATANQRNALQAESIKQHEEIEKGLNSQTENLKAHCKEYHAQVNDLTAAWNECKASRADYAKKLLRGPSYTDDLSSPDPDCSKCHAQLNADSPEAEAPNRGYAETTPIEDFNKPLFEDGELKSLTDDELNISGPHDPTKCPDCQRGEVFTIKYKDDGAEELADCFTCNGTRLLNGPTTPGDIEAAELESLEKQEPKPGHLEWWDNLDRAAQKRFSTYYKVNRFEYITPNQIERIYKIEKGSFS